jgi:hypothetical protein
MRNWKGILFIIIAHAVALASCSKESIHGDGFHHATDQEKDNSTRVEAGEKRNVLLLYSAGYNSISDYLKEDIEDLQEGWIPGSGRNANILLIYSHLPEKKGNYATPTSPSLTRLWKDAHGQIIKDTLVRYPAETHSATWEQLHDVLDYVKTSFPAKSYGMIFSSHATGYLPSGYYTKPESYIYQEKEGMMHRGSTIRRSSQPVQYTAPQHDPSLPAVKSIGQDQVGTPGNYSSYEIELDDFARALPMKMEYILFDACLMGGVEVAYELKEKCRYVGFSQTEVLAEGFDYRKLTTHLLGSQVPNPRAVCEDFYNQYDVQTGVYRSATISMVDCTMMEPLAEVCYKMFTKYAVELEKLHHSTVQRYYRGNYHWFYDLKDIVAKIGATEEELQQLQDALDRCILYKASTPEFMGSFPIDIYSGFSMYLPTNGTRELDKYYRTLQWNKATSLVK